MKCLVNQLYLELEQSCHGIEKRELFIFLKGESASFDLSFLFLKVLKNEQYNLLVAFAIFFV